MPVHQPDTQGAIALEVLRVGPHRDIRAGQIAVVERLGLPPLDDKAGTAGVVSEKRRFIHFVPVTIERDHDVIELSRCTESLLGRINIFAGTGTRTALLLNAFVSFPPRVLPSGVIAGSSTLVSYGMEPELPYPYGGQLRPEHTRCYATCRSESRSGRPENQTCHPDLVSITISLSELLNSGTAASPNPSMPNVYTAAPGVVPLTPKSLVSPTY